MILETRHGTEPKITCFAMFISLGSTPVLLGWLVWEGCRGGEWKQIDIGYSVGAVQGKMCMMLDAGDSKQVRRSQLL